MSKTHLHDNEVILDLDMDRHEVLEDDVPGWRRAGLRHAEGPSIGGRCGAAEAAPRAAHSAAMR